MCCSPTLTLLPFNTVFVAVYHLPPNYLQCYDIGNALDKGLEIDAIYLDLTRAFGTVCHSRLLCKLQALGISGSLLSWFSDYLSSRR